MENEIWKPVIGYEGLYEVSNLGKFKSIDRVVYQYKSRTGTGIKKGKLLKPWQSKGYFYIKLCKPDCKEKTTLLHRVVAIAFLSNPHNLPEVNHKDGDKRNNSVSNLEWCSSQYNSKHAVENGLANPPKGENHANSVLTEKIVIQIRSIYKKNGTEYRKKYSYRKIGKMFNISPVTVGWVINRKTWNHVK